MWGFSISSLEVSDEDSLMLRAERYDAGLD